MFSRVLQFAPEKELLKGKTVAVDSTFIEADAAMKSIVRKDAGDAINAVLAAARGRTSENSCGGSPLR